ncbi:MAG TPA: HAD-IA family hydrolase [Chloroflexota bacterium]|nr:HAD-IA family hydrolase [Chloroflexota bacterium]
MQETKQIDAILFDMYGTLVYEPPFEGCFPDLAAACRVALADFRVARDQTVADSMTGRLATTEDRARRILQILGKEDQNGLAARLAEIERSARWPHAVPYPATVPTLEALRTAGFRIGLVSDCTELMGRALLERQPFFPLLDATALSCEVGYAKPAPEIYRFALEQLGVAPERAVFVGDGNSDELNGARALGMTTVRIDQKGAFGRYGLPTPSDYLIVSLDEVLELPPLAPERPGFPHLDVSWVRPNLAVGGRVQPENLARLKRLGIDSVVDLRAEESDDPELMAENGLRFLHLPMADTFALTQDQMREGSRWVAAERAAGRKVLVHCQHGVGRSVMLVCATLLRDGLAVTDALAQIKQRRPRMALSAQQTAAMYAYGNELSPLPGGEG